VARSSGACRGACEERSAQLTSPPLTEYVATWPDGISHKVTSKPPLIFKDWDRPYANDTGKMVMMPINAWFKDGTGAGLTQDMFRSFDNNHSKTAAVYPHLTMADPVMGYQSAKEAVFAKRVTFGVQSLGFHESPFGEPMAIPEYHDRCQILAALDVAHLDRRTGFTSPSLDTSLYRAFYETNFLFIGPAVWNYKIQGNGQHFDNLSFLTLFYLSSVGKSGSDAYLISRFSMPPPRCPRS
jgi:hypothetical protein